MAMGGFTPNQRLGYGRLTLLLRLLVFGGITVAVDLRKGYGEMRYIALGLLQGRLHVLCFTEITDGIRVISFRKAIDREVKTLCQNPNR